MAKPTPAASAQPSSPRRIERILAYVIAGVVGLSLICFAVVIIATASGLSGDQFRGGFWQAITLLPFIGLPLGFVLVFVLLIVNIRRRGTEEQRSLPPKK